MTPSDAAHESSAPHHDPPRMSPKLIVGVLIVGVLAIVMSVVFSTVWDGSRGGPEFRAPAGEYPVEVTDVHREGKTWFLTMRIPSVSDEQIIRWKTSNLETRDDILEALATITDDGDDTSKVTLPVAETVIPALCAQGVSPCALRPGTLQELSTLVNGNAVNPRPGASTYWVMVDGQTILNIIDAYSAWRDSRFP